MPTLTRNGITLAYEVHGQGPEVLFLSGLGYGGWMWKWLAAELVSRFRVITLDNRGLGGSDKLVLACTVAGPSRGPVTPPALDVLRNRVGEPLTLIRRGLALEWMTRRIPGARSEVLPGLGHLFPVEDEAATALALRRFWEGLGA